MLTEKDYCDYDTCVALKDWDMGLEWEPIFLLGAYSTMATIYLLML